MIQRWFTIAICLYVGLPSLVADKGNGLCSKIHSIIGSLLPCAVEDYRECVCKTWLPTPDNHSNYVMTVWCSNCTNCRSSSNKCDCNGIYIKLQCILNCYPSCKTVFSTDEQLVNLTSSSPSHLHESTSCKLNLRLDSWSKDKIRDVLKGSCIGQASSTSTTEASPSRSTKVTTPSTKVTTPSTKVTTPSTSVTPSSINAITSSTIATSSSTKFKSPPTNTKTTSSTKVTSSFTAAKSSSTKGTIVGVVVGIGCGLIIISLLIVTVIIIRRRRRSKLDHIPNQTMSYHTNQDQPENPYTSDPMSPYELVSDPLPSLAPSTTVGAYDNASAPYTHPGINDGHPPPPYTDPPVDIAAGTESLENNYDNVHDIDNTALTRSNDTNNDDDLNHDGDYDNFAPPSSSVDGNETILVENYIYGK